MRRTTFFIFGVLEWMVAIALVQFGWRLPSEGDIHGSFDNASRVTESTGRQVRLLHQQIRELRRPELRELASRMQVQTRSVIAVLKDQHIDFEQVETIRNTLGSVSNGIEQFAATMDPILIGKLGEGLQTAASYLDEKLAPAAEQAADHLDASTTELSSDARALAELLRHAPLDLQAVRDIHRSLVRFQTGLAKMEILLKGERLQTMRTGFGGLEKSLDAGARQVERVAGYSYPVVRFEGFRPQVEMQRFWPDGDSIASGLRQAAAGAKAARQEMEALTEDLPSLHASVVESRKMADRTREALALTLQQQEKLESVLKDIPHHALRLAETLPTLSKDLSRLLRETKRLKDVARTLRQTQKGLEAVIGHWPELRTTLMRSATLLKAAQGRMQQALEHRKEYETALRQSVTLAEAFAIMTPLYVDQFDRQLQEQEQSLRDLSRSLDEVDRAIPVYTRTAASLIETGRWLLWLVTAIVALHGSYLVFSVLLGRRRIEF